MVENDYRVSVAQAHFPSKELEANLVLIEGLVEDAANSGSDLVVVPETAPTGYFISDDLDSLAEALDGPTVPRLQEMAARHMIHLAIGMPIKESGAIFDAQLLIDPRGQLLAAYKKVHLFSLEKLWYSPGETPCVVETALGKIGMSVCYDFMFPEYIRCLVDLGADLVINSTNWITDVFQEQVCGWSESMVESLARTRALENGVWVAMANCTGVEEGFRSLGQSCLVTPSGKVVASAGTGAGCATGEVSLDNADLARWRSIATYRQDRRPEIYSAVQNASSPRTWGR